MALRPPPIQSVLLNPLKVSVAQPWRREHRGILSQRGRNPRVFQFRQHTQTFEGSNLDKATVKVLRVLKCRFAAYVRRIDQDVPDERDIFLSFGGRSCGRAGEIIDMQAPMQHSRICLTSMPPEGQDS